MGHLRPCRKTGHQEGPELQGHNLLLLAQYRVVYQKAHACEINAFLYRMNYGDPGFHFFSHSEISRAEKSIGLSHKCGSTTARQARLPVNIIKRWIFWNMVYPHGIADINPADMIDLDECGIFLETANRRYGKAYIGLRVNEEGPYGHGEKWTLLMAVSCQAATHGNPSPRWRDFWQIGGTTEERFYGFIEGILNELPHGDLGRRYCFTMDNLSSHHSAAVAALIHLHGHRLAFRAPYYPIDGPIEYVFNTIQCRLRNRLAKIRSHQDLIDELGNAIFLMNDFQPYFRHCGFNV